MRLRLMRAQSGDGVMEMEKTLPVFEDAARDLSPPVMRYLERYVGNCSVAEDLLQETLIRMNKGWDAFEGRSSVKTWAFSIASRVAADYLRQPGRKFTIVVLDEADEPADPEAATVERLVEEEMNCCVRQVIDRLPDAYREVLILHDLEGLSAEQVAAVCGCTVAGSQDTGSPRQGATEGRPAKPVRLLP